MAILRHFLKFCFLKNKLDFFFRLIFFCTVQIKDSFIVDIEYMNIYVEYLCGYRIGDFTCFSHVWSEASHVTAIATEDVSLGFNAFYRWFCACGVTVGANLLLNFLVFDRLRTPVTVEADLLSSLVVFYNWFCKRATAEADFLAQYTSYKNLRFL